MRHWFVGLLALLLTAVVGSAAFVVAYVPALGAAYCPSCYGFEEASDGVYVAAETPREARARAVEIAAAAAARVNAVFGEDAARPALLICDSAACDARLGGGGAKARALGAEIVHVSSGGLSVELIAREFAHAAILERVGVDAFQRGDAPVWFKEGLAALVAEDPRVVDPATGACRGDASAALPRDPQAFARLIAARPEAYADAACKVSVFIAEKGGVEGLLQALDAAARGEPLGAD